MRKHCKNRFQLSGLLAGAALACALTLPAAAQPAASEPANAPAQLDRQERQPTIPTYDKFPDPQGDDQDIDLATYEKRPDPAGKYQSTDYVRYQEKNKANNGENPVNVVIIEDY